MNKNELPKDCQSNEDGICRLPIGSCRQCIGMLVTCDNCSQLQKNLDYWKKRCEAAEEHIHVLCNHPKGKITTEAWNKWQQLKTTPTQKNRTDGREELEKELPQLLHDVQQILSAYAMDETWTDWDESVRKRVIELQYKIQDNGNSK